MTEDLHWIEDEPVSPERHWAVVHWLEANNRQHEADWCRAVFNGHHLNIYGFRLIRQAYADYYAAHPEEATKR